MDPDLRGQRLQMFRHLCACVWGSGGGLMGDITQTDVQLPHPVQMYVRV